MSFPTPASTRQTAGAVRTLCAGLIDYAGLFPPAELPMASAVANYATYRRSADAWALGRFILPVARLAEFERTLATVAAKAPATIAPDGATANDAGDASPWLLSALVATQPNQLTTDLERIASFNARYQSGVAAGSANGPLSAHPQEPQAIIDTIETKAQTGDEIAGIARMLANWRGAPPDLTAYVELPLGDATPTWIARLAEAGLRGKVRTGGVTADAFPTPEALAAFLAACVAAGLPFKATAGLHHAIRATYPLTYAPDSPSAPMYGFLNVVLGAGFLSTGAPLAEALDVLRETDAAAFHFDAAGVGWRDRRLTTEQLAVTRRTLIMGYGSCSFEEPLADLKALGLL